MIVSCLESVSQLGQVYYCYAFASWHPHTTRFSPTSFHLLSDCPDDHLNPTMAENEKDTFPHDRKPMREVYSLQVFLCSFMPPPPSPLFDVLFGHRFSNWFLQLASLLTYTAFCPNRSCCERCSRSSSRWAVECAPMLIWLHLAVWRAFFIFATFAFRCPLSLSTCNGSAPPSRVTKPACFHARIYCIPASTVPPRLRGARREGSESSNPWRLSVLRRSHPAGV